jgi:elongation factor G
MVRGGRYGFPIVDVRAVCTGGKHHAVDSSEMAFKMAGSLALKAAIAEVGVDVLEPVSTIRVHVPSERHGEVLGDLNSRRAQILGNRTDEAGDLTTIEALVPTAEIVRYAIDLRSISGGSGSFEAEHHGYQRLPANLIGTLAESAD